MARVAPLRSLFLPVKVNTKKLYFLTIAGGLRLQQSMLPLPSTAFFDSLLINLGKARLLHLR